jgi:5'-nucleotidase (lipoprotein e(P4) family)
MNQRRFSAGVFVGLGVTIGLFLGRANAPSLSAQAPQKPGVNPQECRLLANLYMITAGEYRACCLQTYRFAEERLAQKLLGRLHQDKAPAVLMDLDETVFDDAGFQTVLYRDRLVYREELWDPWERDFPDEVRLVPGAKRFIEHAEAAGVTVVYISNRSVRFRESTIRALRHNDLNTCGIDDRLLLKDGTSDKSARRALAAERFDVLLLFGDNLRDFSEEFKVGSATTIPSRKKLVDDRSAHFGDDWIVLPNSSYGEWEKLLKPTLAEHLVPTSMPNPEKRN